MLEPHLQHGSSLAVRRDQPLIGIIGEAAGEEVVYYFSEEETTAAVTPPESIQEALNLAGAWSDLAWEEAAAELDQIRHQSQPTPAIERL